MPQFATRQDIEALEARILRELADLRRAIAALREEEPYTEEQQRRDLAAAAEIERGECVTLDELEKELGL